MIRIYIICEGITEELFVKKVLKPHFELKNISVFPRGLKGGFNYDGLKHYIIKILNEDKNAYVTTLIDFYGMNDKYPGYIQNKRQSNPIQKVESIESAIYQDILNENPPNNNFIPHLQLHEYEALLFTKPNIMEDWLSLDMPLPKNIFQDIRDKYPTPEHINDSPQTAPSKQILNIAPFYDKTSDGISIVQDTGLNNIRKACPHFNNWLNQLEVLNVDSK
ncbi:MAG: hypothetical protein ACJA1N_002205 [Saprospiraceae bacterium]|jgi:hypothetical protein